MSKPRIHITVTEEMIKQSMTCDSSYCPTARAIKETFPEAKLISVDIQTIRFSLPSKGYRYTYLTPKIAQLAAIKFDQNIEPEPYKFWLSGAYVTKMSHTEDNTSVKEKRVYGLHVMKSTE